MCGIASRRFARGGPSITKAARRLKEVFAERARLNRRPHVAVRAAMMRGLARDARLAADAPDSPSCSARKQLA